MSRLLIDGYNLIHADPSARANGEEETETLLETLRRYKRYKGHSITVVFDGYEGGMPTEGTERVKGITVIHSRLGEKADQVIERIARKWGGSCVVVTSDREVADAVERSGAAVIASSDFIDRLEMVEYLALKGETEEEEEEGGKLNTRKKGNPHRKSKKERAKERRLKKL